MGTDMDLGLLVAGSKIGVHLLDTLVSDTIKLLHVVL